MGHTETDIIVYNPYNSTKNVKATLIVDTGSTYTWINAGKLKNLEIKPTGKRRFRTIEGRFIERGIGEAIIECLGEKATTIIVFAVNKDVEVLGVHALEGLGLEVDPITKQLRKTEVILAL